MIALGIIGNGAQARALLDHQAPLGRFRLAAFAAGPGEAAGDGARPWQEVAADPAIAALLVDVPRIGELAIVQAGLAAGKIVVCSPAPARGADELGILRQAMIRGGGTMLPCGELTHGEATRRGLAVMADPAFGRITSIYLAIRQPRGSGDVIANLAPEVAGFVTAAIEDDITAVRVNAGRLFGPERDSAVILLRSAGEAVVTIELSRCLPASLPAPGLGEVEIEVVGTGQAVRITPLDSAVRIYRDDGYAVRPWLNAPVLEMLRDIAAVVDGYDATAGSMRRATRAQSLLAAIEAAAG
jgi:predicted dehydrogenase